MCWEEAVGLLPTLLLAIEIVIRSREVNCGGQYLGCNSEKMLGLNLRDRNGIERGLYRDRQDNGFGLRAVSESVIIHGPQRAEAFFMLCWWKIKSLTQGHSGCP